MIEGFPASLIMRNPGETANLAEAIAVLLSPGDTILLQGHIGAGKSHFARAVIQCRLAAAGKDEDVPSPTYTLVQTYSDGGVEIWHADLYRLSTALEIVELGLQDAFDQAICLVEWPDRLADLRPDNALTVHFLAGPDENLRTLKFSTNCDHWAKLLPVLRRAAAA